LLNLKFLIILSVNHLKIIIMVNAQE